MTMMRVDILPNGMHIKEKGKAKLLNYLTPEASFEIEELWENEQLPFKRVVEKNSVTKAKSSRKKIDDNIWTFMDQRTGVLQGTGDLRRESQPGNNTPIKGEGLC